MERRALLAQLGTVIGAGALAGCIGDTGGNPQTTTTTTTTPGEPTIIETVPIGDREQVDFPMNHQPHVVLAVNRSDTERQLNFIVSKREVTLDPWTTTLQSNEAVRVRLQEPAAYTVEIRVDGGTGTPIDVPADRFDCNHSQTTATVQDGGVLKTRSTSTMMACASAVVTDSTIELTDAGCASQDGETATVATANESVTITGTIIAGNPCHGVGLKTVTFQDGTLRVVVETTPPEEGTACVECIGSLDYDAAISFDHDYPETVVVEHADQDGTTVITETTL